MDRHDAVVQAYEELLAVLAGGNGGQDGFFALLRLPERFQHLCGVNAAPGLQPF